MTAPEVARFDELLDAHHWLGRGLVGEVVRQVATLDGPWVALLGWGSPAFRAGARDAWIAAQDLGAGPAWNSDGGLVGVAVDGKWLRGTASSGDSQVKLFAGLLHHSGSVIAQTQVADGTTENAAFGPLLDQIGDLHGKVTADATHTNADNARAVVEDRHGHYPLALKGNQPTAEATVKTLPGGSFFPPEHETTCRGHGRLDHRATSMTRRSPPRPPTTSPACPQRPQAQSSSTLWFGDTGG